MQGNRSKLEKTRDSDRRDFMTKETVKTTVVHDTG